MMALISLISFITGMVFFLMGAWPVTGFFGLDVALIYYAFRMNYRSGRLYERVTVTRDLLTLKRVHPSGRDEVFEFNPYWTRVRLTTDQSDGRASLALSTHERVVPFGKFLTDDERRAFANALTGALIASRTSRA